MPAIVIELLTTLLGLAPQIEGLASSVEAVISSITSGTPLTAAQIASIQAAMATANAQVQNAP